MKPRILTGLLVVILGLAPANAAEPQPIDLVICLDTSGSMEDLIDSARGRIWDIVVELSKANPRPSLRVGLLTYGTPGTSSAEQGWVVHQIGLTDDLDSVYGKMMALRTNGGDEFVGWVLDDAVETMAWSDREDALKLVFVAGNESADQAKDQRDFRTVGAKAKAKDIIVNPIYAGDRKQGVGENWEKVATHGGGDFHSIDVAEGTKQMATPFDGELQVLNRELNATYIPFGAKGSEGHANQVAQDANAGKMGAWSCGSRVAAKGCGLYNNAEWDLVDASQAEGFKMSEIKTAELPEAMRQMSVEQRIQYVKGMQKVRKAIQDEIQKVSVERTQFVQNIIRQTGKLSLSDAMMKSLRNQARTKGFTFPKMKPAQETAVVAGPPKPVTPLAPEIARNIDALLDSLPRVEFRVGSYASGDARFAGLLKEHTQLQVDYFVGDKSIDSEKEAQAIVIRQLNKMAADMQAIREVPVPVASPFPYADRAENRNTVRFQIGGINFSKRSSAEEAHKRILDVVARFKEDHAGGDQKIVLASHNTAGEPTLGVASLREMIRAIATAAGRVWMDKGFGC